MASYVFLNKEGFLPGFEEQVFYKFVAQTSTQVVFLFSENGINTFHVFSLKSNYREELYFYYKNKRFYIS